jgi:branched-chain amino acid aminotransferase
MNGHFFCYDGNFFLSGEPVISAGNRSLRYGDGLFETMRMQEGRILNYDFHLERLFQGMKILQFEVPEYYSPDFFLDAANKLLLKNFSGKNARIRLMVFRGEGGIFDPENHFPHYILETFFLSEKMKLNENGLVVDVFPDAAKSCDLFSNLKSNNYLTSVMAGLFANKNKLDDAIILNAFGRVCESAISNIFIVKGNNIFTPPLSEGCVAGVTRRWMLEKFCLKNFVVTEKNLSTDELLAADEFFLTNSIQPVRWVKSFGAKKYKNEIAKKIFEYIYEKYQNFE